MSNTKYEVRVELDQDPMNPRTEWDNFGTMVCKHGRYALGDQSTSTTRKGPAGSEYRVKEDPEYNLLEAVRAHRDYCESWEDEYSDHWKDMDNPGKLAELAEKLEVAFILPLYLYDHSGLRMSTGAFGCPWDSGQVGYIYVTKEAVRREFGAKRISPKRVKQVYKMLEGEVETYDQYLTGQVYGFIIDRYVRDDSDPENSWGLDEECVESCWGFYGEEEYCRSEGKELAAYLLEQDEKAEVEEKRLCLLAHLTKLKTLIKNHVPIILRQKLLEV